MEVELTAADAAELARVWSKPATPGAWRGESRDGEELRIERGREGDILIGYGERARFHLDRDRSRLRCEATVGFGAAEQRVLLTRVLPLVAIARGREALHAGAVRCAAGVLAVVGPSGAGKSTLVAALVRRGHPLVADDVLVVGPGAGGILAWPASPHLSLDVDSRAPGTPVAELGGKRWIEVAEGAAGPAPLVAVALLERGPDHRLGVHEVGASPLTLVPYMLGLPDDEGRDAERFGIYSDLVEGARIFRLAAALDDPPAAVAAELVGALGLPSSTLLRSAA